MDFTDRRKVVMVAGGSLLATAALVAVVFSMGSWAYHTRRFLSHERRLDRVIEQRPTAADLSTALLAEPGTQAIAVPRSGEEIAALVDQWSPRQTEEVLAKRRTARDLRIFAVGDMVYFLFFDGEGRLQAYVLIGN
jgi:hypothetical protein